MDFVPLSCGEFYSECEKICKNAGFFLVELKIFRQNGKKSQKSARVEAVISSQNASSIGIEDCEQVHRPLLALLKNLLQTDDVSVTISSPGIERNIKNAAEFAFFCGKKIRVWHIESAQWILGTLVSAENDALLLQTQPNENRKFFYNEIAKAKFFNL